MTSRPDETMIRVVAWILAAFVLLVFLTFMADHERKYLSSLPYLLNLVGASIVLAGVLDLLRQVIGSQDVRMSAAIVDLCVILSGGMFAGGSWGAAVGLGLIGAAALFAERRSAGRHDEEPGQGR